MAIKKKTIASKSRYITPKYASLAAGVNGQYLFADPVPSPDAITYQVDNTSAEYYNSPYYLQHQAQLQKVPPPNPGVPLQMQLANVIEQNNAAAIQKSGSITFHAAGDTGQVMNAGPLNEEAVTDMMVKDFDTPVLTDRPSFCFHLGDVVYNFGEEQYYYDQFYEPFRNYNAPIFAVPGNHDGTVYNAKMVSLAPFRQNFCAKTPATAPNASGHARTTMNQPGVYFTLDAPFVSIIGLWTNVLEGPGVISPETKPGTNKPAYPGMNMLQKNFLISELERLKTKGVAVILALHHPPFSGDPVHGGTLGLSNDLDDAFTQAGFTPHAILSGHAHLYQRFTRNVNGISIPYVICGCSGYNAKASGAAPPTGTTETLAPGDTISLNQYIVAYGYLKLMANSTTLGIQYNSTNPQYGEGADSVFVNLANRTVTTGRKGKGLI